MNRLQKCKYHVGEGAIRVHMQLRSGYLLRSFWISESIHGNNSSATSFQVAIKPSNKNLKTDCIICIPNQKTRIFHTLENWHLQFKLYNMIICWFQLFFLYTNNTNRKKRNIIWLKCLPIYVSYLQQYGALLRCSLCRVLSTKKEQQKMEAGNSYF